MVAGSLIGAALSGLAVAVAPEAFLKVFLGVGLVVAAAKTTIGHSRRVGHWPAAIPVAFSPFAPPPNQPASKAPPSFRPSKDPRLPLPPVGP
jgi:uncharacterized membrane protein YfcA